MVHGDHGKRLLGRRCTDSQDRLRFPLTAAGIAQAAEGTEAGTQQPKHPFGPIRSHSVPFGPMHQVNCSDLPCHWPRRTETALWFCRFYSRRSHRPTLSNPIRILPLLRRRTLCHMKPAVLASWWLMVRMAQQRNEHCNAKVPRPTFCKSSGLMASPSEGLVTTDGTWAHGVQ